MQTLSSVRPAEFPKGDQAHRRFGIDNIQMLSAIII
jgi:hypothetical protein